MKRWGIVVAAGLLLVGCGSSQNEPTTRACNLLASAEDSIADATNAYVAQGKPAGVFQPLRDAVNNYPALVSRAASEALSAPAEISASFQESAKNAELYRQAVLTGDTKSGGVFAWSISHTVDKCRAAGVDMQISDIGSG